MEHIINKIKKQIELHDVVLYMKGTPKKPHCGFSKKVVDILLSLNIDFYFVDVLENSDIRSVLPQYSNWPTFPQLWIHGKLIGGCDIVSEMFYNGELLEILKKL